MATCADQATAEACLGCCATEHEAGYTTYVNALINNCACADGSSCSSACAPADPATPLCPSEAGGTPDQSAVTQACVDCLGGLAQSDSCTEPVVDACTADQDCIAMAQCQQTCPRQ
jgi:hypothetical protein